MLSFELILAVATFAFVTSATPGPNNIMLTASGVNFGYRRTLPHMLGIICGMATMNIAVGLGLGAVFTQFPLVQQILRVVGSAYGQQGFITNTPFYFISNGQIAGGLVLCQVGLPDCHGYNNPIDFI